MAEALTDLLTLDKKSLEPPKSRVKSIEATRNRILELKEGDKRRSNRRALIQALIDGEPPYDEEEMAACGRGDDANINFRGAEGRVAAATTPYYELDFGVPTAISLNLEYGDGKLAKEKLSEWAATISQRITDLLWAWSGYKLKKRMSHYQMVVYGHGPIIWPKKRGWHFEAKRDDSVWVADNADCDLDHLEEMAIPGHFNPVELWKLVDNAPDDSGWDKKMVKQAIRKAAPKTFKDTYHNAWSQYEASLRRGDTLWNNKAARIYYTGYYVKEFSGKITYCIVLDTTPNDEEKNKKGEEIDDFVFKKVGWFDSFHQIICPFHFDVGPDEHWWSVKGLGPKIYDGSDTENRFLCTLLNNAASSSGMMLQAKSGQALQTIQQTPIVRANGVTYIPPDWEVQPMPNNVRMDGPIDVLKIVTNLMNSNTGQYEQIDNPPQPTLGQQEILEKGQSALTRGQYDWYYAFSDDAHKETVRRMFDPNLNEKDSGGEEALEMRRKLVEEDEIPEEVLKFENFKNIHASRGVGYGSPQMQHIVGQQLIQMAGTMSEEGRQNAFRMNGAVLVGQTNVDRFWPKFEEMGVPNDQEAWATFENNVLRMPQAQLEVTPNQNSVVHFITHFKDMMAHLQQVKAGQGDPVSLITHLDNGGAHNHNHLEKIQADPTRKEQYKQFNKMHVMLAKLTDQVKKQVQKAVQSQQQPKPQIDPEAIAKIMKVQGELKLKEVKLVSDENRKDRKLKADLERKDLTTAANIHRRNAEVFSVNGG
jgi:hypothetical protein